MFTNITVVKGKNIDKNLHNYYQNEIFSLIHRMNYIIGLNDEDIKISHTVNIVDNIILFNHKSQKYEHDKIDMIGNFDNESIVCSPILSFKHVDYTVPKPVTDHYTPETLYDVNLYKISNSKNDEEYFYTIAYNVENIKVSYVSNMNDIRDYLLSHVSNTDPSIIYLLQESPIVTSIKAITVPNSFDKLLNYFPFVG